MVTAVVSMAPPSAAIFFNLNLVSKSRVNSLGFRVSSSNGLLPMRAEFARNRLRVRFSTGTHEKEKERIVNEKRSLAVATGEFFISIASLLLKNRKSEQKNVILSMRGLEDVVKKSGLFRFVKTDENEKDEEIASVTKDEIDPSVLWEQRKKDVEAERGRRVITSPGFSFSAAGLLFPYHLGVAQCLIEKGYITENTPLAGSSAGAIVCAVIASGASMQDALKATKELAEDCRLNGTAFRLGAVLRGVLDKVFPDDVHVRANGRIRVAITQVFRSPRALLVDQFDSKEDLIDAVFTSSFIPGYLAPRPVTVFRKRICVDGGLTLFMPPTAADKTVRVCAFPVSQLGLQGIGISPDCNPENRASTRQLFNWALEPAGDDILDELFDLGYRDANVWTDRNPINDIGKPNMTDGFVQS
ncbi:hypothetical protein SUGI_0990410 [Cryptomeria japonica]|uniref:uncharacterized protein LOC131033361 n=1 Tax=Cryptomeria japonica TaxID=3369 RepID=UPI00241492BC|nr:uncharacterized protein LOC131033361 [Cryptomeria japonica]GLJ46932.1 hypothetical protein SUGI_0990410 [Cryptomeria japonica]